ncbi:MAG: FMN-dependent NADH-azoreductase [Woeseiaceae bacterium]|nr:FMN-dependent NADH-azoreductase [Woeseiaceae bacterium]NIP21938.1 FMN-dependent NADH-azoreductase [Woeseiaceae bacterium]NIS91023.1 FMN-dependent NADH-azoreductase [Woeseiaceae bacterium]
MKILEVSASGRRIDSVSRRLTGELIDALESRTAVAEIIRRDLSEGIAHVDESWIAANFTPAENRTRDQKTRLNQSDALVAELQAADVVVIGAPIYNFGIPAALKAWIDMIARARLTFRYTENGPEGLLKGKKAYIVIASGGVPVDSAVDFATPYLRQALRFVGITDVDVIAADQLNSRADESMDAARTRIAELIHTAQPLGIQAA